MTKPVRKVVSGKINISLWATKDGENERACLQHSRKDKTGEWHNQQIWLNINELQDVADALRQLEEGDSPSHRVNHIMGYIRANSLDAGLDCFDVDEFTVNEILAAYGIRTTLTLGEARMLRKELRAMIEQQEFAEIARCAV